MLTLMLISRNGILRAHTGKGLRKVVVNDRSAPMVDSSARIASRALIVTVSLMRPLTTLDPFAFRPGLTSSPLSSSSRRQSPAGVEEEEAPLQERRNRLEEVEEEDLHLLRPTSRQWLRLPSSAGCSPAACQS